MKVIWYLLTLLLIVCLLFANANSDVLQRLNNLSEQLKLNVRTHAPKEESILLVSDIYYLLLNRLFPREQTQQVKFFRQADRLMRKYMATGNESIFHDAFVAIAEEQLAPDTFLSTWLLIADYTFQDDDFSLETFSPRLITSISSFPFINFLKQTTAMSSNDPGEIFKIIVDGSGCFCSSFKHPEEQTYNFPNGNLKLARLAKFGFLVKTISARFNVHLPFLQHFEQLLLMCQSYAGFPLDDNRRKLLTNLLVSDIFLNLSEKELMQILTDFNYRLAESAFEKDSICQSLFELENAPYFNMKHRFPRAKTRAIFFEECIDDLRRIWNKSFNVSPIWQPYKASAINRWAFSIRYFVSSELKISDESLLQYDVLMQTIAVDEQNFPINQNLTSPIDPKTPGLLYNMLNVNVNEKFDRFLKLIVDELPARIARDAYEKGEGICDVTKDETFVQVYQALEKVAKLLVRDKSSVRGTFVKNQLLRDMKLIEISFIKIACHFLKMRYVQSLVIEK